eukprot:4235861-Heterocapsa_arctica.AAC.1
MVGHPRAVIEIDQYKICGKRPQEMTTKLRAGNEYSMQSHKKNIWAAQEMHAGHILCQKPCTLQEHHDKQNGNTAKRENKTTSIMMGNTRAR